MGIHLEGDARAGDDRYNDHWSEISLSHFVQKDRDTRAYLKGFEAIDPQGFRSRVEAWIAKAKG